VRRTALPTLVAAVAVAAPAASAPPAARLVTKPPATAGAPWTARLSVRPHAAPEPGVVARLGAVARRASVARVRRGLYRVRLVFPAAGVWRLEARVGARRVVLGRVSVRAGRPVEIRLETPAHAVLDGTGGLLVVEAGRHRVLRVDPRAARVSHVAGSGTVRHSGDGGPARSAGLGSPFGIAVAPDGGLFVTSGERLRRIDRAGRISTVAVSPLGLGPLAADARSVFFFSADNRLYRYSRATGATEHYAGTGETGFAGDGGPAAQALFNAPHGLALAPDGALLVTDTGNDRLRRIDPATRVITTVAAGLAGSWGIAVSPDGTVYVGASTANRVYRIALDGSPVAVAGSGRPDSSGDGGPAATAGVPAPVGIAADGEALYVVEARTGRIRRVDLATGTIATLRRR
jgi:sugar lactone lactonase YvrE